MLCSHAVTNEDGHPLGNEGESGRSLREYGGTIFQARMEGERHNCHETILRYVQKAPDDIRWEIDRNEFDELMATKKSTLWALVGFLKAFKDVWEAWVLSFSATHANMCLRVPLSLCSLPRAELYLFHNPLTLTTMEGLSDRRRLYVH